MKLGYKAVREICPTAPFNFDATFQKPSHFQSGDNYWEPGVRWQTFRFVDKCLGVIFRDAGSVNKPKIEVIIHSAERLPEDFISELVEEVRYRYNLDLELTDFYQRFSKDKVVGPVIKKFRGMRPGHPNSLYEYIIIGIVLQNCTVRRSVQMLQALFEKYGTLVQFANKKLWCFWGPGDLKNTTENELRSLKVGYRAKYIKKIDDYFSQGFIDELKLREENRETQMEELLKLYGVGPATVWYLLFDVFHHWDFFNHISPWEQKIYSKLFFNKDPDNPVPVGRLLRRFDKFGDYKQLAVHYIWEDLWWQRKNNHIPWLEKLIRL